MNIVVQKYGGTSVASIACFQAVADRVIEQYEQGDAVLVVLSAMSGETDRLERLAREAVPHPDPSQMDVLLSTGEQISIAILTMILKHRGVAARSYTGSQVAIRTDGVHTKARIEHIDVAKIQKELDKRTIIVVAGFQGVDGQGNITTLGRGGSDTTAVGLAVALDAKECQIFTDVDGVYTTDPRVVPNARRLSRMTFEEMLELSSLGAKVLQIRSVEFAGKYNMPIRVLSTFKEGAGTLIHSEDISVEQPVVTGIAFHRQEAKIVLRGVPDKPGMAATILTPIAQANIEVDMIVQNMGDDGTTDFAFTVHRRDFARARAISEEVGQAIKAHSVVGNDKIAKVSLVGVGMRSHAGIATRMFRALADAQINIELITTSEIKVSVVVDEKSLELGVRAMHEAFGLHEAPVTEETAKSLGIGARS